MTTMTETKVRSIPWWTPLLAGDEAEHVRRVIDANYLNDGKVTTEFEERIAALVGAKHGIAVTSGTAAIFLSLAAFDIGPGDEVIVPDMTFIATANAVRLAGATPVLVDVDPVTLNVSPAAVEAAITPRTKAVVPVHVSGRGADLEALTRICREHRLIMVEDAAEGFMSVHNGRYLGTFGDTGCFSFSPNKTITTGQGGVIVTNDDGVRRRLRELKDQGRPVQGTGGDDIHHSVGFNFKLTNMQASVGLAQLRVLPERLERAKLIYRTYRRELAGVPGVRLPGFDVENGESPQWTDAVVDRRDELDVFLTERGAHCRRFWLPIHTQAPYRESDARFPNVTSVASKAIWLSSNLHMTEADVVDVCSLIREFYEA
jgi:perosamine synthetase